MDIKQFLKIAGVENTPRAKRLVESMTPPTDGMSLVAFLQQHPNVRATVNMGTHSLGHSDTANVSSAQEFMSFVSAFCDEYVEGDCQSLSVVSAGQPNTYSLVFTGPDGVDDDFDGEADEVGHFILR